MTNGSRWKTCDKQSMQKITSSSRMIVNLPQTNQLATQKHKKNANLSYFAVESGSGVATFVAENDFGAAWMLVGKLIDAIHELIDHHQRALVVVNLLHRHHWHLNTATNVLNINTKLLLLCVVVVVYLCRWRTPVERASLRRQSLLGNLQRALQSSQHNNQCYYNMNIKKY
jgi:hypothetical protein